MMNAYGGGNSPVGSEPPMLIGCMRVSKADGSQVLGKHIATAAWTAAGMIVSAIAFTRRGKGERCRTVL